MSRRVFFPDKNLYNRISNFLQSHVQELGSLTSVDADDIVEHLRTTYREYQRSKLGPLRSSAEKALLKYREESRATVPGGGPRGGGSSAGSGRLGVRNADELSVLEQAHLDRRQQRHEGAGPLSPAVSEGEEEEGGVDVEDAAIFDSDFEGVDMEELQATPETNQMNAMIAARYQARRPEVTVLGASGSNNHSNSNSKREDPLRVAGKKRDRQVIREEIADGDGSSFSSQPPEMSSSTNPSSTPKKPLVRPTSGHRASSTPGRRRRRRDRSTGSADDSGDEKSSAVRGVAERPTVRYEDLGGIEAILQDIRELIERPMMHPEIYTHLGAEPPRGILLHGPPGCGKTLLAHCIAGELNVPFLKISAPEIVSGMSGESEAKLRDLFADAETSAPCIIFIDEIDAIVPKRETAQREMEKRIVAQLLTCMDAISLEKTGGKPIIVLGATNRPDSVDEALRRAGRFDREISLGIPDEQARARILSVLSSKLRLSGDFDFSKVAHKTPGFVGADLHALVKEAAVLAINRIFQSLYLPRSQQSVENPDKGGMDVDGEVQDGEVQSASQDHHLLANRVQVSDVLRLQTEPLSEEQLAPLSITMEDFEAAISKVQPSSKREGFATIPDVSWDDVGALDDIRKELELSIVAPIEYPERFKSYGLSAPTGILLYGPPGCGKTLLAKAVANESGANFISIKGPELLNKFVGESERAVRQVFARARASSPCVIFFDELDALCPKRDNGSNSSSERVVNQLLTELDGLDERRDVFVIAATNRPDMIDPAMLRPGRLDKPFYVSLPTPSGRLSILQARTKRIPLHPDISLEAVAASDRLDGFSGADLDALVREAALKALQEDLESGTQNAPLVLPRHMEYAMQSVFPSVSKQDQRRYDRMKSRIRRARAHVVQGPETDLDLEKEDKEEEARSGPPANT